MKSTKSKFKLSLLSVSAILVLSVQAPPSVADPQKIATKTKGLVTDGNAEELSGFYMDKSRGYYSYIYITIDEGKYKAVYQYKEKGEINRGFMVGDYNATEGWGVGKICYENTEDWLAKGGIVFTKKGEELNLRVLYTETDKPTDTKWKNDWDHSKQPSSKKAAVYSKRYLETNITCD